MNHWEIFNADEPVKSCVEASMYDSLINLSKDLGVVLKSLGAVIILGVGSLL